MKHVADPVRSTVGRALGRVPSGVFVLTAAHGGRATAMMVSWVQQAAFEPAAVSVAIARQRPAAGMIRASGVFALSILPEADTALMKRYARGVGPDEDPFAGVATSLAPSKLPVLSDALGWLDCRVVSLCEFGGDHDLFVGQVMAGALLKEGAAFSHQRGSGFHY